MGFLSDLVESGLGALGTPFAGSTAAALGGMALEGWAASEAAEDQRAFNREEAATARAFNREEAATARSFNASEAEKSRIFAERMSSTAYSRVMADMRRAGINPMLAISQGGASTPGSASASAGAASAGAASSGIASVPSLAAMGSTAVQLKRMDSEIKKLDEEADLADQHEKESGVRIEKLMSDVEVNNNIMDKLRAEEQAIKTNTALQLLQMPEAKATANVYDSKMGEVLKGVEKLMESIGLRSGTVTGAGVGRSRGMRR